MLYSLVTLMATAGLPVWILPRFADPDGGATHDNAEAGAAVPAQRASPSKAPAGQRPMPAECGYDSASVWFGWD